MLTDLFNNAVATNNTLFSGQLGWKHWVGVFIVLFVVLLAAYGQSLNNPFHYDDLHSIRDNPHIRTLENIPAFFVRPDYFTADPRSAMYRPLVLVSYALNYGLDKLQVQSYHWVNIGVHALNSALLVTLGRMLLGGLLVPILAGLIFALHPVNSEVVNYISSRSESLCAAFFLSSCIAYIRAHRATRFRLLLYGLSLLAFVGALLCKSVAVMLVPLLVLCEWLLRGPLPSLRTLTARLSPFLLIGIVYVAGMRGMLQTALVDAPVRDMGSQWATQTKALVYYVKLLAFPWELNVEHQFFLGRWEWAVALSAALLLAALVVIWRRGPLARGMALWFLLVLAPTFFVPLNVLVNEHRLYIPSAAFALAIAVAMQSLMRNARWGAVCVVLWLLVYAGLDMRRTEQWRSPEALWGAALAQSPQMPRPHIYMGNALRESGRNREALQHYARALSVNPRVLSGGDMVAVYNNMGAAYLAMEQLDESVAAYERALQIDPDYAPAKASLEGTLALRADRERAGAMALQKQGLLALVRGELDRAAELLERSLRERPMVQTYMALVQAYERLGDEEGLRRAYRGLVELDPNSDRGAEMLKRLRALEERKEQR